LATVADAEPRPLERLPGYETVEAALASRAAALASNPWLDRFPVALCAVVPARDGERWALVDADEGALRLSRRHDVWPLVALSGGHRLDVFGELERGELAPLAAAANGRTVLLT
jgi:hypothetical protein